MAWKMFKNIGLLFLLCFFVSSCTKDKPKPNNSIAPNDSTSKILIVCEGSLGNGNASLSVYNPTKDSMYNKVYESANGQALGDVFQSANKINNQYFLCINNSDKIIVIDKNNWLQTASISVPKPRYICEVGTNKAYVGSLFSNKISILNTAIFSIEKRIEMPFSNVEKMLLNNGNLYACCWDTGCNKIYTIDPISDKVKDSIILAGAAPHSLVIDKNNTLWVLAGNAPKNINASLTQINLTTKKIVKSYHFSKGVEAIKLCVNSTADKLFFIEVDYNGGNVNNGIFSMDISDNTLPATPLITCAIHQYFWALGIDPNANQIYVGDPKGFVQKGELLIYDAEGNFIRKQTAGLGISSFYFN